MLAYVDDWSVAEFFHKNSATDQHARVHSRNIKDTQSATRKHIHSHVQTEINLLLLRSIVSLFMME